MKIKYSNYKKIKSGAEIRNLLDKLNNKKGIVAKKISEHCCEDIAMKNICKTERKEAKN